MSLPPHGDTPLVAVAVALGGGRWLGTPGPALGCSCASVSPLLGQLGCSPPPPPRHQWWGHSHGCLEKQGFGCQQEEGRGGQRMPPLPSLSQMVLADALGSDVGQVFPMGSALTVGVPAARGQIRGRGAGDGGAFAGENPLGEREGGKRFPQELGTNLAPWGGGKQPPAPLLPPAPTGGNAAQPFPAKVGCAPLREPLSEPSAGTRAPCGTCWGGPCGTARPGSRYLELGGGGGAAFYC